ncbi:MAG: sulfatase-like hydrolase/transferase [Bacteroidetes bacterium]|nr:sulfatase-like hydrolase/transferase [Bacteroidota bacterium]
MMNSSLSSLKQLLKSLLLGMLLYSLCRFLFYGFNFSYFSHLSVGELCLIFLAGLRYDLSVLLMINAVFCLFVLLPLINKANKHYQQFLKHFFALSNALGLLLNCIDFSYFKFTLKRTTAELFFIRDDVGNLLPQYLIDYWYILLIWIGMVFLLYKFFPKRTEAAPLKMNRWINFLGETITLIIVAPLVLIGIRGGIQVKPLRIINAAEYTDARNIPLVVNTPFAVIKSINSDYLVEYTYFKKDEIEKLAPFIHPANAKEFKKQNVVIIILESFSKEYIGYFNNGKGYTPFLDSLAAHSFVCENAFANGKKSIEGIPAVLAGVPSLMENPYLTSVYGSNQIDGLGALLQRKGYTTSFYHGGNKGTMGFDAFAKLAGFANYYSRSDYTNEADFDGNWGIYDEPYFRYFAQQLQKTDQPFCSAIFSLSSHHPYPIPEKYKNKFPKGTLEIHASIGYTDYALAQFFALASRMDWFKNTLFVITADHTSLAETPYYQGKIGSYSIPILFYKADNSMTGKSNEITQQIDILPSVLAALNYNESYFSYGNSVFDTVQNHFNINYLNGIYQYIHAKHALHFDGEKTNAYYDLSMDSLLQNNISTPDNIAQMEQEKHLKAYLQHFNAALIHNQMTAKSAK